MYDQNEYNFENALCITYMCALQFYKPGYDVRLLTVEEWLNENIGEGNFSFGFEDYGQHGEWMLYTRDRADLLAFKLRFGDMHNECRRAA